MSALLQRNLGPCLVAALLVTAGVATVPVPATAVAESPSFAPGTEHVYRGDVASVPVSTTDGANVTISVAGDGDYSATLTLRDADGDGSATLRLNTYDATYSASGGDGLTVRSASVGTTPLAVGTYDLFVCAGDASACDAETAAGATQVTVAERSTDGLRTWVAPQPTDLSTLSDIETARDAGTLTRSSALAKNDTLVLELRASGLEGALAARNGSNATARFDSWLDGEEVSLDVVQTTPSPERAPLHLNVTDPRATTVIHDAQNHSYYLVVDTERVPVTDGYPGTDEDDVRVSEYRANFTLTGESALADERESVVADFEVRPREAEARTGLNRDRVRVESAPNRTVAVRTTLAPGSNVTAVVEGERDSFRFRATGRVRNSSEGSVFAPTFDFSGVAPGTNFSVTVLHRGESIMGYGGPDPGTVTEASANVELGRASKLDVGVTAELSHGGFVVVRRGSADGERLGNSRFLVPGAEETALVSFDPDLESNATLFAVAFRDSNGNGEFDPGTDEPYTDGEEDHRVTDSETVTFEWSAEETTAVETTRGTTESPVRNGTATTGVATDGRSPAEPDSGVEIPGFGVGVALVALLAVALLARNR